MAAETLNVHGRSGEEVSVTVRTASGEQKIEGSDILVAARRIPNTAGIGLEEAGVEVVLVGNVSVRAPARVHHELAGAFRPHPQNLGESSVTPPRDCSRPRHGCKWTVRQVA